MLSAAFVLIIFLLSGMVQAGPIDFDLINNTRFGFDKVQVAKHDTSVWSMDLLEGKGLAVSGQKHISILNKADWNLWDLKVEYREGHKRRVELFTRESFELPKIKRIVMTVISGDKWDAHYSFDAVPIPK